MCNIYLSLPTFSPRKPFSWNARYVHRLRSIKLDHLTVVFCNIQRCIIFLKSILCQFVDFFDSFFFVLRKKSSHLSLLHLVHHGGLPIAVWFGPRFVGGKKFTWNCWNIKTLFENDFILFKWLIVCERSPALILTLSRIFVF